MDGLDISVVAISIADKSINCFNVSFVCSIAAILEQKRHEMSKLSLIGSDRVDPVPVGTLEAQIQVQRCKMNRCETIRLLITRCS